MIVVIIIFFVMAILSSFLLDPMSLVEHVLRDDLLPTVGADPRMGTQPRRQALLVEDMTAQTRVANDVPHPDIVQTYRTAHSHIVAGTVVHVAATIDGLVVLLWLLLLLLFRSSLFQIQH
jgi:hypothetical protein